MKSKLTTLLIICGGALAGFTASALPFPLAVAIILVGALALSLSVYLFNAVYSGKVWGIKINASSTTTLAVFLSVLGLILGGYAIVCVVIAALQALSAGNFIGVLVYLACLLVPFCVGLSIAKKLAEKLTAKSNNALCLGDIALFQEIDANIDNTSHFVVGFEGVALYSATNYCFAVYRYEDYQLGELSTPGEVAMVGMYFVQKYHEKFTFKVDVEVIPGEPGQTVVAVGSGGIAVGKTSGTADQRLFRSYIFTRK